MRPINSLGVGPQNLLQSGIYEIVFCEGRFASPGPGLGPSWSVVTYFPATMEACLPASETNAS